jgi:uncharacterized protein YggU (UPF0235/DUF167 family)
MYIKVRVKVGQRKESIERITETDFVVLIKQKAERNLANKRIVEIFQDIFHTKNVRIISGVHHPIKMLSVEM